jgi:MFS family permease
MTYCLNNPQDGGREMSETIKSRDVSQGALGFIPPEVWRIALVIVFGAFMAGLDTSLVNVGLETIGRQLHSSLTSVQWVTSGYLLALAGALPVCGWLGRYTGAGRLWLWALVGFTVTSGLCARTPASGC